MPQQTQRWEATGRRKRASARVRLSPGTGRVLVNGRPEGDFFRRDILMMIIRKPFVATGLDGHFDVTCTVRGGGLTGAAGAVRHGISRALLEYDEKLRPALKRAGFLTRDAREKERKKYGMKGARARFQFSKR